MRFDYCGDEDAFKALVLKVVIVTHFKSDSPRAPVCSGAARRGAVAVTQSAF
jgi:hypothetical protein